MNEHPIENLMKTAMNNIKEISDVNTIVGTPIKTDGGVTIIPISKVSLGFAAGGTEFYPKIEDKKMESEVMQYPFGGGSGAAVNINPIGFIIIDKDTKFIPVEHQDAIDKLLDYTPEIIKNVKDIFNDSP